MSNRYDGPMDNFDNAIWANLTDEDLNDFSAWESTPFDDLDERVTCEGCGESHDHCTCEDDEQAWHESQEDYLRLYGRI